MLLKNKLYQITTSTPQGEDGHHFKIKLDEDHEIFQGHFPGEPILPGVCMMEIGKELLMEALGKPMDLVNAKNMKFPAMVDPRENAELELDLQYSQEVGEIGLSYSIKAGETTFFKFKGAYKEGNTN